MPKNKSISQELDLLKNDLIDKKLKDVNFDTLDLTDVVDEVDNDQLNYLSNKDKAIEELVKEVLKPELKKWLNKNLPVIVRELVEKEIKKIIPKNE
ncbi:DUF2497 domain-containing protein [Rickettsiales endosymbiont of Trichoplax sp. H2]|uniref:DUF2497 domain-containing protein n=1 Tax=Rickettsiales endosymbiont of Trichoplax sp. H2 TaxID=2021221 RepID=UPI0012B21DCB|nr:Uncharacterized protein [Rickettsiales endosymbiont of Trichoplax sp. H2]